LGVPGDGIEPPKRGFSVPTSFLNKSQQKLTQSIMPSTLNELLALERALSAQIEAAGERCVSLWGKGASLSC